MGVAELQLTNLRTDHLLTLVDDVGIIQHADGIIPNRESVRGFVYDVTTGRLREIEADRELTGASGVAERAAG